MLQSTKIVTQESKMTLLKYYKHTTCYSGIGEFYGPGDERIRYYPDEFLVAQILSKYVYNINTGNKKIVVITEPWGTDKGSERSGMHNTIDIFPLVEAQIRKNPTEPTLLLIPLTFGFQHPGIVVDMKNKVAMYLDPFGREPQYFVIEKLLNILRVKHSFQIKKPLQTSNRNSKEADNRGPLLTAAMMQITNDFIANGSIFPANFISPDSKLNSHRMFQLCTNNSLPMKDEFFNEIMLADIGLWYYFLEEQAIKGGIAENILRAVREQKIFLSQTSADPHFELGLNFMRDFQNELITLILLQPKDFEASVNKLLGLNNQLMQAVNFNQYPNLRDIKCLTFDLKRPSYLETIQKRLDMFKEQVKIQVPKTPDATPSFLFNGSTINFSIFQAPTAAPTSTTGTKLFNCTGFSYQNK